MSQDSWIDGLIQVAQNKALFEGGSGYLDCSAYIKPLEVPEGKIDGSKGDIHKEGNPHYWLNPENGKKIAQAIRDKLKAIDPKNSMVFDRNYQTFSNHLDEKIREWKSKMEAVKGYSFLSYHLVWSYFYDFFELNAIGQLEPLPGIPPTPKHLAKIKEVVTQSQPVIVLSTNFYPRKSAERFSKRTNSKYVRVPSNVGSEGIESYSELFDFLIMKITK